MEAVFERIDVAEGSPVLPDILKERFTDYPITSAGAWREDQLTFRLRWEGGYANHLNPDVRTTLGNEYRQRWQKAAAPKTAQLDAIKTLPIAERKRERKKIRPFPGVTMTFEGFDETEAGLVVKTRVGNYAQVSPDFGISSPSFLARLQEDYPDLKQEDLWKVVRGMGVQIHAETADGFHIFGQRAANVMGAGFISSLGITPNISDEQMREFNIKAGWNRQFDVPSTWLFDSIRTDIAEHDELNLESAGLEQSGFESLNFIGAIPDSKAGWMTLLILCKLNVTSSDIKGLWSAAPDHEYNNLIFVKNNPASLTELLCRPNVYPSQYGGYHAYFRMHHPELF